MGDTADIHLVHVYSYTLYLPRTLAHEAIVGDLIAKPLGIRHIFNSLHYVYVYNKNINSTHANHH